jgi:hypothetical protein
MVKKDKNEGVFGEVVECKHGEKLASLTYNI